MRPESTPLRRTLPLALIALASLSALVAILAGGGAGSGPQAAPRQATAARPLKAEELATIELFRNAAPSVVYITSLDLRRSLFSLNVMEIPRGTGTGFIWDERGHVVTNYHVIEGASAARITLGDQSTWDAELVGVAPSKDLAVLRLAAPPDKLRPIALGTSADLQVGQQVLAIGNPFGFDRTLTTGIISALGREIQSRSQVPIRDLIQTDAAINPGNSGGPLLDSSGRLIGVSTAIFSPSGAYAGIGFAIPADTVAWVVPELIARGRLERPSLGVEVFSPSVTANLGLEGALVYRVLPGSGAQRAGLRGTRRDARGRIELGDLIVEVDGRKVRYSDDLDLLLQSYKVGDRVEVSVVRGRELVKVSIELGPPPD